MILTTINQFREVVPTVGVDIEFEELKPYCDGAERWLKNNILGRNLYDYVNNIDNPVECDLELKQLCLNIIANHAFWDATPFLDLLLTNSGFGVISNNNKAPASRERVERLRKQCLSRRDNEVENLMVFLEQNQSYHELWKDSPAYSLLSDCLINTASDLKKHSTWNGSRHDFLKLKPQMINFTIRFIYPIFSKDFIDSIIELQRNNMSGSEIELVELLKYALGYMLINGSDSAEPFIDDALRFINENIADFPIYKNSREYILRGTVCYENAREASIFSSLF